MDAMNLAYLRTLLALIATIIGLSAFGVHAQDSEDTAEVGRARAVFEEAADHHRDGRYALAAESFQRAYDLLREASGPGRAALILFNLGTSLDEIPGREQEARDAYARFLAEAEDGEELRNRRRTVQQRIRELNTRIQGPNGGGSISPVGPIVLGVGGAVLVAGAIVGAISLSMSDDFGGACSDLSMCPTVLQSQYEEMRAFSAAADVMLVAGGAVAILGLVLTLTLEESAPNVSASCTTEGCGAVVRGSF